LRLALALSVIALLSACGASPDGDGWYNLRQGSLRLSAGELGDGCRLIGGEYPDFQLDPRGVVRPDAAIEQCDALVELQGLTIVLSSSDGNLHPAYQDVALQPLLVTPTSMYMSLRGVTTPGSFRLPIVYMDGTVEREAHLSVKAIDPR